MLQTSPALWRGRWIAAAFVLIALFSGLSLAQDTPSGEAATVESRLAKVETAASDAA